MTKPITDHCRVLIKAVAGWCAIQEDLDTFLITNKRASNKVIVTLWKEGRRIIRVFDMHEFGSTNQIIRNISRDLDEDLGRLLDDPKRIRAANED